MKKWWLGFVVINSVKVQVSNSEVVVRAYLMVVKE